MTRLTLVLSLLIGQGAIRNPALDYRRATPWRTSAIMLRWLGRESSLPLGQMEPLEAPGMADIEVTGRGEWRGGQGTMMLRIASSNFGMPPLQTSGRCHRASL